MSGALLLRASNHADQGGGRQRGPRGTLTYLAPTADQVLPAGKVASLVYVVPKYKMPHAFEDGMSWHAPGFALALPRRPRTPAVLADALRHDVYTRMRLRQRFCTVFETDKKEVLDVPRILSCKGGGQNNRRPQGRILAICAMRAWDLTDLVCTGALSS